jgi:predicted nucleotidyltransferase
MGLLVFLENLLGCRVDVVTAKGLRGLSGRDDGKEAKNP